LAHFARTRAPGFWTLNSPLASSESADFDTKIYKAINGDEGGAWMPSAPIEIGGSGVDMGGLLNIGSAGEFNAASGCTFTIDTGVTAPASVTALLKVTVAPASVWRMEPVYQRAMAPVPVQLMWSVLWSRAIVTFAPTDASSVEPDSNCAYEPLWNE
jgi:hypothetical protein